MPAGPVIGTTANERQSDRVDGRIAGRNARLNGELLMPDAISHTPRTHQWIFDGPYASRSVLFRTE
jgi:hypothetical protein